MADIYLKFLETVKTRELISSGDSILLALSAGKDSMAMLDLMLRFRDAVSIRIGIFHLNHLTRGLDSDNDAIFVKEKADGYGISFYENTFDFKANRIPGISFEEQARDIRYKMIDSLMTSEKFNKAATAHNSRDNVETVLMRIFSGTGIFGLKGISHRNDYLIRPLLDISPDEIYLYLKEKNISWREDISNSDNHYRRNYIRNIVIPLVTDKFPDAEYNINRLSRNAEENENLLSYFSGIINPDWLTKTESGHFINTGNFYTNLPFIKYMISRALLSQYSIRLNSKIFDEIIRRFQSPKSNQVLYEKENIVVFKTLRYQKPGIEILNRLNSKISPDSWDYDLKIEKSVSIFIREIGRYLNYRQSCFEEFASYKKEKKYIFLNIPDGASITQLRNRKDGDRIALEKGYKKIKELMIEKKLDTVTKKSVPLIVINDEIAAYLPGVIGPYPDRVSCNFWIKECSKNIFVFYFTDLPDFNIIN